MAETAASPSSDSRIRDVLKHVALLFAFFVGLQAVFFACNAIAELVPKEPMEQHIEASRDDPLIKRRFDNSFRSFGSQVTYDNNRFVESLIEKDDYDGDIVKASILDTIEYDVGDRTNRIDYFRYWHGWQLLAFTCLFFGPISTFAFVVALIVIASTIWFLWELKRYLGWPSALVFTAVAFFATNLFGNFMGDLLLALSVFALVACCAAILHWGYRKGGATLYRVDYLCLMAGCVFCFLDFYTVPSFAIALGVFSSLFAGDVLHTGFKRGVLLFVRYTVLFGFGFVGTWVAKWALAACVIGLPAVWSNVADEMGFWTESGSALIKLWFKPDLFESHPRFYALAVSFYNMVRDIRLAENVHWNPVGLAAVCITAGCILAYLISTHRGKAGPARHARDAASTYRSGIWTAFLPVFFIPVYTMLFWSHTVWHMGIFGYKPWAVVLAIVGSPTLYMALSRKETGDAVRPATPFA